MKEIKFFIHKTSILDKPFQIGENTKIWHFCHISKGTKIGKDCSLGQNVYVGEKVKIGNFVKIQNNVSIYTGVTLEDYVFCGPSMVFTNDVNPRSKYPKHGIFLKTLVKEGASIGANATIVCGITIGKHSLIGSGSVVVKNVPDYALVYGVPAKINGWICECGEKINFTNIKAFCHKCHKQYQQNEEERIEQL